MCFQQAIRSLIRKVHGKSLPSVVPVNGAAATSHCCHESSARSGFGLGLAMLWEGLAAAKDFFSSCLCGMRAPDDLSHACLPLGLRLSICERQALQHSLSRAESSVLLCLSIEAAEGFGRVSVPPAKPGWPLGTSVPLVGEQAELHKRHETQLAHQAPHVHPDPRAEGTSIPVYSGTDTAGSRVCACPISAPTTPSPPALTAPVVQAWHVLVHLQTPRGGITVPGVPAPSQLLCGCCSLGSVFTLFRELLGIPIVRGALHETSDCFFTFHGAAATQQRVRKGEKSGDISQDGKGSRGGWVGRLPSPRAPRACSHQTPPCRQRSLGSRLPSPSGLPALPVAGALRSCTGAVSQRLIRAWPPSRSQRGRARAAGRGTPLFSPATPLPSPAIPARLAVPMAGRWAPSRLRPGRRSPVRSLGSPPASSGVGPPLPATALPLPPAWQGPAGLGGTLGDPQAQLHLPADGMEAGRGGKPAVKATVPLAAWRRGRGGHGGGHGASKSLLLLGGGGTHIPFTPHHLSLVPHGAPCPAPA